MQCTIMHMQAAAQPASPTSVPSRTKSTSKTGVGEHKRSRLTLHTHTDSGGDVREIRRNGDASRAVISSLPVVMRCDAMDTRSRPEKVHA